jgi:hypothetical protein
MVPWSGVCVAAALADIRPDELARRNFLPVTAGIAASALLATLFIVLH